MKEKREIEEFRSSMEQEKSYIYDQVIQVEHTIYTFIVSLIIHLGRVRLWR